MSRDQATATGPWAQETVAMASDGLVASVKASGLISGMVKNIYYSHLRLTPALHN